MKYSEIRDSLKTGDIVLFSGSGLISTGIKIATKSKWSHVAMVLKLPQYDFVTLWESTTLSKVKDLDTGTFKKGVQLVPFSKRVETYEGEIAVRKLTDVIIHDSEIQLLMRLRKELSNRNYEEDKLELIKSAYDGLLGISQNQEDLSSLFCSELVAEAYQTLGLLDDEIPSNEYTPADFSYQCRTFQLLKGFLSEEIIIEK